ncbi:MAG: hypothetical protein KDD89_04605 [Anaerolineales bacterium]|nr:hypothetical protein [Anaerolineales bacterium]
MSDEMNNTPQDMGDSTSDDRLWSLLGYILPIIAIIALLMEDKRARPFIRHNAVNALMIAVITFLLSFTVCGWIIPVVYSIFLGVQAYQGQKPEVPVLTKFAMDQGWIS